MVTIRVIFTCYYDYDVEVDNKAYEENPGLAEHEAIEKAYEQFYAERTSSIADTSYDEVEVEVQ